MESNSIAGRIHLSRASYERVHDLQFEFEERKINIKGKFSQTYLLNAKHHQTAPLSKNEQQELISQLSSQREAEFLNEKPLTGVVLDGE